MWRCIFVYGQPLYCRKDLKIYSISKYTLRTMLFHNLNRKSSHRTTLIDKPQKFWVKTSSKISKFCEISQKIQSMTINCKCFSIEYWEKNLESLLLQAYQSSALYLQTSFFKENEKTQRLSMELCQKYKIVNWQD